MTRIVVAALASALALSGCGTSLPMEEAKSPALAAQADDLRTFPAGAAVGLPAITRALGAVEGHSCKNKAWQPVSEEAALRQMKIRAKAMGANGIVEVKYDWSGTQLATNCWKSVTASGIAVVFAP